MDLFGPIGGPACCPQTLLVGSRGKTTKLDTCNFGGKIPPGCQLSLVSRGHQLQFDCSSSKWQTSLNFCLKINSDFTYKNGFLTYNFILNARILHSVQHLAHSVPSIHLVLIRISPVSPVCQYPFPKYRMLDTLCLVLYQETMSYLLRICFTFKGGQTCNFVVFGSHFSRQWMSFRSLIQVGIVSQVPLLQKLQLSSFQMIMFTVIQGITTHYIILPFFITIFLS